jgi:hypothetical protein
MTSDNTLLNIVDFGGDILTDGQQSSIISPDLDAYTLSIVNKLYEYESKLTICFPGVDGELSSEYLNFRCQNSTKIPINKELWLHNLNLIYNQLKESRPGNTIPNMINILSNNNIVNLSKHWIVGSTKVDINKPININYHLQQNIHIMDLPNYNPFINIFNMDNHPYQLTDVVKNITDIYSIQIIDDNSIQSCDLFLQYLRKDSNGYWTNKEIISLIAKDQEVMIVDIYPYINLIDKKKLQQAMDKLNINKYTNYINYNF